jgi:hypothetical protein
MCRIPKVVLVAPSEKHLELRKALSSLEYDIVAAVEGAEEAASISAMVAVAWEPEAGAIEALREAGLKTVAVGGNGEVADMTIDPDQIRDFKTRIWELFR